MGQHHIGQVLPGHGLQGFNRLQGVGEVGHQRGQQMGLFLARLAGNTHQEMGQANHHNPGHDGDE